MWPREPFGRQLGTLAGDDRGSALIGWILAAAFAAATVTAGSAVLAPKLLALARALTSTMRTIAP